MTDSYFNTIVILDAIPEGELNTAHNLKEDLEDISYYVAQNLIVRYYRLNNISDLQWGINEIWKEIKSEGIKPWLHLEGHGISDESGFVFADKKTPCSWTQLKQIITPINIELHLNLMLILASCFGGTFASAIETTDRAPILGLIGPAREVTAGELQNAFSIFYKTFFTTLSLGQALDALDQNTSSGLYYRVSAEKFFYLVWSSYKRNYCTEEALEARANKLYQQGKKMNLPKYVTAKQIKSDLQVREPDFFKKFRDTYFMHDLFEENKERFPVTYEQAESVAFIANKTINPTGR
jgi:hypothetical protein